MSPKTFGRLGDQLTPKSVSTKPDHPSGRTIKVKLAALMCPEGVDIKPKAFRTNKRVGVRRFMKNKINRLIDAFVKTCESGVFLTWGVLGLLLAVAVQFAAIGISGDQEPKVVSWCLPAIMVWLAIIPVATVRNLR